MLKPIVNIYKLGSLPYIRTLDIQRVLFDRLRDSIIKNNINIDCKNGSENSMNSLLIVEHEPVYTIGLRTNSYGDNYVSRLQLELEKYNLKADFVSTNRGGLITFHGPGQLVAYPIIYLGDFTRSLGGKKSLKAYVHRLEETIIETLARIGLPGAHTVKEYPGVWVDHGQRKIAFIGIHCNRYVTMHGISINCDCDLTWFDHIVSCGIKDKAITSIKNELLTLSSRGNQSESFDQFKLNSNNTLINEEMIIINNNHDHNLADNITKTNNQRKKDITTSSLSSSSSYLSPVTSSKSSNKITLLDFVSEAFCTSFRDHFDCTLLLKPPRE